RESFPASAEARFNSLGSLLSRCSGRLLHGISRKLHGVSLSEERMHRLLAQSQTTGPPTSERGKRRFQRTNAAGKPAANQRAGVLTNNTRKTMHGTVSQKIGRVIGNLISHPQYISRCLTHNVINGKTPLDLEIPWFSYAAIDFLEGFVQPHMSVFEYGSGG